MSGCVRTSYFWCDQSPHSWCLKATHTYHLAFLELRVWTGSRGVNSGFQQGRHSSQLSQKTPASDLSRVLAASCVRCLTSPPSRSPRWLRRLGLSRIVTPSLTSTRLPLSPTSHCDYTGQSRLPSHASGSITSTRAPLPRKVTQSQALGIGRGHVGGDILPVTLHGTYLLTAGFLVLRRPAGHTEHVLCETPV